MQNVLSVFAFFAQLFELRKSFEQTTAVQLLSNMCSFFLVCFFWIIVTYLGRIFRSNASA